MNFHDLFEEKQLLVLKKANKLVYELNKRLAESNEPLKEVEDQLKNVLSIINEVNCHEIFLEDYVNDVESFILDLVISLKERGLSSIPLSKIELELRGMGLELDKQFLIDYLSEIDGVQEVIPSEDAVIFNTSVDRGVSDDEAAREKEKLKTTATKVAKSNMKDANKGRKVEIK